MNRKVCYSLLFSSISLLSIGQDINIVPLQIGNSWYFEGVSTSNIEDTHFFSVKHSVIDSLNFSNQSVYIVESTTQPSVEVKTLYFYADSQRFCQSEQLSGIFSNVQYDEFSSDTSWQGEFSGGWIRNTQENVFGITRNVQSRGSSFSSTMSSSWSETKVTKHVGPSKVSNHWSEPWGGSSRTYSLTNAHIGMQDFGIPCRPVEVEIENNLSSVTISWIKNQESNISHYNIYMSTDPDSNWQLVETVPSSDNQAEIDSFQNQYDYYFVVKAVNSLSNESSASQVLHKPTSPPGDFSLILPHHYSWLESETSELSILFSWERSIDPDGDSINYRLHLEGTDLDTMIRNIYSTSYEYQGMLKYYDRYKWDVFASDGVIETRCSEYFHFLIKPPEVKILSNRPNPFNGSTAIKFNLPRGTDFHLIILNLKGQVIKTLSVETESVGGVFERAWDGTDDFNRRVESGIYFCKLITNEGSSVKKLILLK